MRYHIIDARRLLPRKIVDQVGAIRYITNINGKLIEITKHSPERSELLPRLESPDVPRDAISSLLTLRAQPLRAQDRLSFHVVDENKLYCVDVTVAERGKIVVGDGERQAIHLKYSSKVVNSDEKREGELWLSDDGDRSLLKIKSTFRGIKLEMEQTSFEAPRERIQPDPQLPGLVVGSASSPASMCR